MPGGYWYCKNCYSASDNNGWMDGLGGISGPNARFMRNESKKAATGSEEYCKCELSNSEVEEMAKNGKCPKCDKPGAAVTCKLVQGYKTSFSINKNCNGVVWHAW